VEIPAPDYSTLSLRLPRLDLELGAAPQAGEPTVLAVDATNIKVTNRGEWMRRKRKGYVKTHVAVDVTKRAVSLEVSSEKLKPLVEGARRRAGILKVLGDGGYDTHDNFTFLVVAGIEAGIKVRGDSNPACEGPSGEVVRAYLCDPLG